MILIISMCRRDIGLLEDEFVRPIKDIVGDCQVVHYLDEYDPHSAHAVILSGTALADDAYLDCLEGFEWIRDITIPVLGICAGAQMIAKVFGASLSEKKEIGFVDLLETGTALGIAQHNKAYALHHLAIDCPLDFIITARSKDCIQMISHKTRPIHATLFHPEVMNKDMIRQFVIDSQHG